VAIKISFYESKKPFTANIVKKEFSHFIKKL